MVQAWDYLWDIYIKFTTWIFTDWVIYARNGRSITFGWFMVAAFVFSILVRNLLMLPKISQSVKLRGSKDE